MKILHTSDWHLGHQLYGYDREEEQRGMLDQMVNLAQRHKPDVFLLSGDVYHTAQPSAAVQRLFAETIVRLHETCSEMRIIVTAGNHDSGAKHEIFRLPWQSLGVDVVGNIDRENYTSHIIRLPDIGYVIAVPYCYERALPPDFFQTLLKTVAEENNHYLPVVLMAHTTIQGCDYCGHDHPTERTVGGIDALSLDSLGHGYDYLALGHIHHAQWVHGAEPHARYSGSPIAVSFDECYGHSVSIVEINSEGIRLEEEPIHNPRPLVTLPTTGAVDWDEAKRLLSEFPADIPAYIRLRVVVDDFLPASAPADAEALTEGKACHFCTIAVSRRAKENNSSQGLSVEEFREQRPIDIVRRFAQDRSIEFGDDLQSLFEEAEQAARMSQS